MNKAEMLYPVENAYRQHRLLDGIWYFAFESDNISGWEQGIPKDRVIPVPGNISEVFLHKDERHFVGNMWYQKDIYVPKSWLGQDVFVRLDGVGHRFIIYVNGIEVTRVEEGYLSNAVEVTRHLQYGDKNSIIIKVNNELSQQTIPRGQSHVMSSGRKVNDASLMAVNGIIKSVHLFAVPNTRILDYQVKTLSVEENRAEIHYSVNVQGNCLVTATLRNREGKVVATGVGGNATLTVENPHLWTIGDGYLYRIDFEVSRLGKQTDSYSVVFGIRTFTCEKGKLALNNKPVYIKALRLADIVPNFMEQLSLSKMKRVINYCKAKGINALLVESYPLSEEVLNMLSLGGILIIDNIPTASIEKKAAKKYVGNFQEEQDQIGGNREIIFGNLMERDKNYACTICWTIALPTLSGKEKEDLLYIESLAVQLEKNEAYRRLYALEIDLGKPFMPEIIMEKIDILILKGLESYKGYLNEERLDTEIALQQFLIEFNHKYPDKVVIISMSTNDDRAFQDTYERDEWVTLIEQVAHKAINVRGEIVPFKQ